MDERTEKQRNFIPEIKKIEQEQEKPWTIHSKEKALSISITEGAASSVSFGFGSSFITPFAVALKANALQIGWLSALSSLASPIAQVYGSELMEKHPRKKIVLSYVFLELITWLPIIALAFMFMFGIKLNLLPYLLIVLFTLSASFGAVAYPPWFSWMGDIVPENAKGKYFSKRNIAGGATGIIATIVAAIMLDRFKELNLTLYGFITLFALALIFRFVSLRLLRHQYSPKIKLKKSDYFSLGSFIKRFDNYGKFSLFRGLHEFSRMIAAPFFAVYMLEVLNFGYLTFIIVAMSSSAFYLLFSPLAGKFSDKYGNTKLLYISGILAAFIPLFWLFTSAPVSLVLTFGLFGGIMNAALVIGTTNFTYDSVNKNHRGLCVSYTNLFIGLGVFIGSIFGGFLIENLNIGFNPFFAVFILSAILRLVSTLVFIPFIKEEKAVNHLPPLQVHLSHPFQSVKAEIGWIRTIFK